MFFTHDRRQYTTITLLEPSTVALIKTSTLKAAFNTTKQVN